MIVLPEFDYVCPPETPGQNGVRIQRWIKNEVVWIKTKLKNYEIVAICKVILKVSQITNWKSLIGTTEMNLMLFNSLKY